MRGARCDWLQSALHTKPWRVSETFARETDDIMTPTYHRSFSAATFPFELLICLFACTIAIFDHDPFLP